jgi:hypothetical protein
MIVIEKHCPVILTEWKRINLLNYCVVKLKKHKNEEKFQT